MTRKNLQTTYNGIPSKGKMAIMKYSKDMYTGILSPDNILTFQGVNDYWKSIRVGVFCNSYKYAQFSVDGKVFYTSEQYYQYKKALCFGDVYTADRILDCANPELVNRAGRQIIGFHQKVWDRVRVKHMKEALYHKFTQNEIPRRYLLDTGDAVIVETSQNDDIWGAGCNLSDSRILTPTKWPGMNLLGFLLMELRDEIREMTHEDKPNIYTKCTDSGEHTTNTIPIQWDN